MLYDEYDNEKQHSFCRVQCTLTKNKALYNMIYNIFIQANKQNAMLLSDNTGQNWQKAMWIQVHIKLQFYRKVFKSQQSNISFNALIISIKA